MLFVSVREEQAGHVAIERGGFNPAVGDEIPLGLNLGEAQKWVSRQLLHLKLVTHFHMPSLTSGNIKNMVCVPC